jgi:hypothetical protein
MRPQSYVWILISFSSVPILFTGLETRLLHLTVSTMSFGSSAEDEENFTTTGLPSAKQPPQDPQTGLLDPMHDDPSGSE